GALQSTIDAMTGVEAIASEELALAPMSLSETEQLVRADLGGAFAGRGRGLSRDRRADRSSPRGRRARRRGRARPRRPRPACALGAGPCRPPPSRAAAPRSRARR